MRDMTPEELEKQTFRATPEQRQVLTEQRRALVLKRLVEIKYAEAEKHELGKDPKPPTGGMKFDPDRCPECGSIPRGILELLPVLAEIDWQIPQRPEGHEGLWDPQPPPGPLEYDYSGESDSGWDGQDPEVDEDGKVTLRCLDEGHNYQAIINGKPCGGYYLGMSAHPEMIRDLIAALENTMFQLGAKMTPADMRQRREMVNRARRLVGQEEK